MSNLWKWLKPAALLASATALLRLERQLALATRRREIRHRIGDEIDRRVEEDAEAELPEPTLWPVVAALGVAFGLWGIVLHTFFFGIGLFLIMLSLAGWMNLVFHDKPPYQETTPTEEPLK